MRILKSVPLLLLIGCSNESGNRVEIRQGSGEVINGDGTIHTRSFGLRTRTGSVATTGMGLELLATVTSPIVGGTILQATDVTWVGDHVYASYNVRGDEFLGALQIIDAQNPRQPVLVAEAVYHQTDLAKLQVSGNRILVAGADEQEGATLETYTMTNNVLAFDEHFPLGSYSATYLSLDGYQAYMTHGDVGGGVVVFDLTSAPQITQNVPLFDARWVEPLPEDATAVLSGSPSQLFHYTDFSDDSLRSQTSAAIQGGTVGAPTWATRREDVLFVSADEAGLLVYDLRTLDQIGQLPTTGNANGPALAIDGRLAFLANGQEGLVVVDVLEPHNPLHLASIDVTDDRGSANAVSLNGNHIALADGLGGVKLLEYARQTESDPTDCDGDGIPDADDLDDDDDGVLDEDDSAPCDPDIVCLTTEMHYEGRFLGDFFNLPCDHPDVEGPVTGVVRGTLPSDFDWYDPPYYVFSVERDSLLISYSQNYFPVDTGICGDPFYFAAHWYTTAVASEGGNYTFEMGSDDDAWLFVDDNLIIDIGGIHAIARESATVHLDPGPHRIEIYFAERHVVQSGLEFEVTGLPSQNARLDLIQHICLDPSGDIDGDGESNSTDIAPLTRP